jgi:hypothetical protein
VTVGIGIVAVTVLSRHGEYPGNVLPFVIVKLPKAGVTTHLLSAAIA